MERRTFVARAGGALAGSRLAMSWPAALATWATACTARDAGRFRVLSDAEAADIEAIAARILPSDDSPGAVEAGVIHFIDAALADLQADLLEPVRSGLNGLREKSRVEHGEASVAGLSDEVLDSLLGEIEESEFFLDVRFLTLAGMFSNPSYGGNRNEVGWALIGFDQGPTMPPFGAYDADYAERGA